MSLFAALNSPVGRKILTGVTGIGLVLFVIAHMAGNLSYLFGAEAYNLYAHKLMSLGGLFYAIEILLALCFLLHAYLGIVITIRNRQARPDGYKQFKSAGGASRLSWSSRSMIVTGVIILIFLVLHLNSFKFGTYYSVEINGEQMRDLYRLMSEKFQDPIYAFGYPAVMILLGLHLRHGVWSAFQSLTLSNPKLSAILYPLGLILGTGVAVGFIVVPLYIYF